MAIPEMDNKDKREFTGRDREMMPAKGRGRWYERSLVERLNDNTERKLEKEVC
jgi:hypothetical protein